MIDWALTFARDLSLAVWLGGLIVIDLVETPARFRVPAIDRNQVVAVGREVFAAFNRTEAVGGGVLIAVSALFAGRTANASHTSAAAVACVSAMWLVALAQCFWARPRMSTLANELDLVNRRLNDARFRALTLRHKTYVALDVVKAALGLAALGMWV